MRPRLRNTDLLRSKRRDFERVLLLLQRERTWKALGRHTSSLCQSRCDPPCVWEPLRVALLPSLSALSLPSPSPPLTPVPPTKELGKSWEEVQSEDDRELLEHQEE